MISRADHTLRFQGRSRNGSANFALVLFVVIMLLALGSSTYAQPNEPLVGVSAEQSLQFAEHLYSLEEYFRAIGEYKRFLFHYPDHPQAPTAAFRIVQCYFHGKRWEQAIEAADTFARDYPQSPLTWKASLLRARALAELNRGEEARKEFLTIIMAEPNQPIVAEAWYYMGLSYARESRWLEADESFRQIVGPSRIYSAAQEVRRILTDAEKMKRKDPVVAGIMAAVIPGSGHLYCGRSRDAALAFLLTGGFVVATVEAFNNDNDGLGIGLGLATLAIYAGNIFSAVNVAHKFNDREERRIRERLAPYGQISSKPTRRRSAAVAFRVFF
ncbi:MAG: tetratricopeptide repeat protein [Deltaproteobacteria bacterium]|nr:MAG: tetratricopeptide repeat protein [Deltaproteobacteria bacterium]